MRDEAQGRLRELVKDFKHDIIGIAEPRVSVTSRSVRRFSIQGFNNSIIHNSTNSRIGNLWVMRSLNIVDPEVLNCSHQAITISVNGVHISIVRASSDQVTRRALWNQLDMGAQRVPWLVVGDFNCVLRNKEKKGGAIPRTAVLNEFSDWLDDNSLFEAESLGSKFTWSNRQSGVRITISKLDLAEVFGNVNIRLKQAKLRLESALRLTDGDPYDVDKLNLMRSAAVEVNDMRMQQDIMLKKKSRNNWLVEGASNNSFFHNSIRIRRSSNTISELVDDNGVTITNCDQIRDLIVNYYEAKFNGYDSIPVKALFDIYHPSIYVEECASIDRLPTLEEIHAAVFDLGADSAPGPDGFASFFYRHCWEIIRDDFIFTKILDTRLGDVLEKLISEEQVAFMKGRNIHENISLASEMVNETQIRRKEGNVGLKLDITQEFDTSARISVLVNGSPEGFFSIDRGLRQGDPLSPLIFVLIEYVLTRNITKLFRSGCMTHMVSRKGNMKSLRNLVDLLSLYQRASGQTMSLDKSKLYYGGGSLNRRATIAAFLGMPIASFPDRYLGVKVMSGPMRYHHVANVFEQIKDQLSGWKGRLLSFQDRVVLVKSVIASYSVHNMAVYKWPRKFFHECEVAIQNFLWSGDSKALLMSLWWKIRISKKVWARFLRARFFMRNGNLVHYNKSSILPGIKWVYSLVEDNTKVLIGDGRNTFLFYDVWVGDTAIADILEDYSLNRVVLVGDILVNGAWNLTEDYHNTFLAAGIEEADLPFILDGDNCQV
ncbi:uncharacterized protein LOC113360461 [Papaver somniferum]|uniref:uncharacterized protein LOC113360461 n=1 Tax=Papaver somniferum TaxID=3469 RepID=UPI000E701383|nr:uncharacterized protein LOC113360461 [Papaver somniferum]